MSTLADLVSERGLTYRDLATLTGYEHSYLWRLAKTSRKPPRRTAEVIASCLDVPVSVLWDDLTDVASSCRRTTPVAKAWDEWLAATVRHNRQRLKLSQDQVADRVGLSLAILSKIERGQRTVTFGEAVLLANALGFNLTTGDEL